jgi:hypothetical protein
MACSGRDFFGALAMVRSNSSASPPPPPWSCETMALDSAASSAPDSFRLKSLIV